MAVVINRHTLIVAVEEPSVGALQAHLVVPVPYTTSDVGGPSIIEVREDAVTFTNFVAFVA